MTGIFDSRPLGFAAAAATLLAAPLVLSTPAAARAVELECRAGSERSVAFEASHERWTVDGKPRREFEAEIDVEDGTGFSVGQQVNLFVNGRKVASRPLVRERDGDLSAEVEFKSWKTSGLSRFPAGFPAVKVGTVVAVRSKGAAILSCTLR
jgi:hypothetical protein